MHEGMVHALRAIHRILKPNGTLIDLRPDIGNRSIWVELSYATLKAGEVDSSDTESDRLAADEAIQQAVADGLFTFEYDATFDIIADLDTVDDLRDYKTTLNRSILSETVIAEVEQLIVDEDDDYSIRIPRPMIIASYRKL